MLDAERIESSMEQTVLVACLLLIYVDNVMSRVMMLMVHSSVTVIVCVDENIVS
jgi:hypothetical protein